MTGSDGDPVISVEGLVKRFGSFPAVDGLDLTVEQGEVHGFLGPNGAGKTTAIRVLLGLYRPDGGRVRVMGMDPARQGAAVTRRISYVPGDVSLWPNLTGQEVLDALAGLRGARDQVAERRLIDDFALDPRKLVRTYSKGNRQKVLLVAAFAAPTDLLVLDEPTSGLDPLMEELFQRCVREAVAAGRTVLLSSHILAEAEQLCGRVTIIRDGRLVESGALDRMRHLAASTVTARVPPARQAEVRRALSALGLLVDCGEPGATPARAATSGSDPLRLALSVPRADVPVVLGLLTRAEAADITCTPARLEDLFLRHYEAAAR